jgi:hypothetical protein
MVANQRYQTFRRQDSHVRPPRICTLWFLSMASPMRTHGATLGFATNRSLVFNRSHVPALMNEEIAAQSYKKWTECERSA